MEQKSKRDYHLLEERCGDDRFVRGLSAGIRRKLDRRAVTDGKHSKGSKARNKRKRTDGAA